MVAVETRAGMSPALLRTGTWNGPILAMLCLVLLLSGAAGLVYQVTWVRLLGLTFGVTIYAISTVLAAFMAGLAIGSVLGGRVADSTRHPLRVYGVVELAIGLTALASPWALTGLQEVYRGVAAWADPGQAALIAGTVRTLLAFAVLLVPTALMGASLPLAVRGVRRQAEQRADSQAMGMLYAFNTLGALIGTLAAGFVLIGSVGMSGAIALAALANATAGVSGLVLDRRARPTTAPAVPSEQAEETVAPRVARVVFVAFAFSGAVSFAYEVVWSRILAILFDSTIYGFVLMLATVLLGIAVGSAIAGWCVPRLQTRTVGLSFGWLEVGVGLAAVFSLAAFGGVHTFLMGMRDLLSTEPLLMAAQCVLTVLPAALLLGATFPVAARLWAAGSDRLGERLGGIYAGNVAGAIVGSLVGGFVLVPLLGAHASLLLLAAVNVLIGAWLLLELDHRLMAALAAALGLALVGWGATRPAVHTLVFGQRHPDQELLWYQEGLESTVSVARDIPSGTQILYTNSLGQSSDAPDIVRHHQRIGHLGALLAPRLERVLVIGLGVGSTAGAVAQHADSGVEIVELSPAVAPGARMFDHTNGALLLRPNVGLAIDDGRNHLLRARQPYDLVVADIIHPYNAGGNNLYSVEYFKLVSRALAPDGLMVQWVPLEDADAHRLIVRTFLEAFPNATLWLSTDVLVGSNQPLAIDRERLNQRLADPGAQQTLNDVGFVWREHVMAQFRSDTPALRAYAGEGPILSDDRPVLEYFRTVELPFTAAAR
jgi:spermidine synthase